VFHTESTTTAFTDQLVTCDGSNSPVADGHVTM